MRHQRLPASCAGLLILLFTAVVPLGAQTPAQKSGVRPVDRIVAIVNGEPILWSDIVWQVALTADGDVNKFDAATEQRVVQAIIDTRLLRQEAEKLPTINVSDAEVNRALAKLIAAFPSETLFREKTSSAGLTGDLIREIVRERIEVSQYVDFRFRSFVVVSDGEVAAYYEQQIIPLLRSRNETRSLDESRAEIRALLTAEKVVREMETWLVDARERAEIVRAQK